MKPLVLPFWQARGFLSVVADGMKHSALTIIAIIVCLLRVTPFMAVPAYPHKIKVKAVRGKEVVIYLHGDESRKFASTPDGCALVSYDDEWWYANVAEDGNMTKSDFRLAAPEDESNELRQFKAISRRTVAVSDTVSHNLAKDRYNREAKQIQPVVGERHALVILMQFKDLAFTKSRENFEALFNTIGYREDNANGSVRDFYRFASQGQLDYISDVFGPYTAQNPMRYYGGNSTNGGSDARPLELCVEALRSLPADFDPTPYDNDGDGLVDNVHIIFAGFGEEAGASANAIWSHEYPRRINLTGEIGFSVSGYSCSPELRGNNGTGISRIGVVCHELGHALGAMDYYDTNYSTGGEYLGTGKWDIMAQGSWNDNGRTPPNFNPYVRTMLFGWNTVETLASGQQIVMPRREIDNADASIVYKMETASGGDYFLIENRQQNMFDAALPGAGLMVYHVHPSISRFTTTNSINATHPQGLYPVCAAYSEPSRKNYGNINSPQCPFPGSNDVRQFSAETSPAAVAWNGASARVALYAITQNPYDGSITFSTGKAQEEEPELPQPDVEQNLMYKENFESRVSEHFTLSTLMGKGSWQTYKKGNLVINADNIPEATDGETLFMLYTYKGASMVEAEAVSTDLDVEAGRNYVLNIDVYTSGSAYAQHPLFNIFIEDEYGEYNVGNVNETTGKWTTLEIPLTFASDRIHYKLYGKLYGGAIFLDNVRLYAEEQNLNPVLTLRTSVSSPSHGDIYTLNGTFTGTCVDDLSRLPAGFYIVRNGDRFTKLRVPRH